MTYPYYGYNHDMGYPSNNLIRVTGIDGAKAYQMGPNSTMALFDGAEDLMYIKSTDGAGFPTIRTFKFEEVPPTGMSAATEYMTRAEVEAYVEQFVSEKSTKSNSRKSKNNDEQPND